MFERLRIAVASKDGIAINEHFGHAKLFWIYDIDHEGCWFKEKRNVDHYCLGGYGDKSALSKILTTISDCRAVFVAKIGDGPTEKLAVKGIEAVSDYTWEGIEDSLKDYFQKHESQIHSHAL